MAPNWVFYIAAFTFGVTGMGCMIMYGNNTNHQSKQTDVINRQAELIVM